MAFTRLIEVSFVMARLHMVDAMEADLVRMSSLTLRMSALNLGKFAGVVVTVVVYKFTPLAGKMYLLAVVDLASATAKLLIARPASSIKKNSLVSELDVEVDVFVVRLR
jgi:hypothetical protein